MDNPTFTFAKIKSGVSNFSNNLLLITCRFILVGMTNNPNFLTPTPTLAAFEEAIDNFSALMATAKSGSKYDRIARNESRKVLVVILKALADYVTFTAQGNPLILASSNFELVKAPQPNVPVPVPSGFKVVNGLNSGEFKLSVKAEKSVKMYGFQYTGQDVNSLPADDVNWTTALDTKRQYTITGLTPGVRYAFRITMSGVRGQITYSNVIFQICQ